MASPAVGGFTDAVLAPGMQIVFEAISPSTGAAVSGVKVANIGILAEGEQPGTTGVGTFGNFSYVPGPGA